MPPVTLYDGNQALSTTTSLRKTICNQKLIRITPALSVYSIAYLKFLEHWQLRSLLITFSTYNVAYL